MARVSEAVAAPETVLMVFNSMRETITPERVLEHTRALFAGDVIRAAYVTPEAGEASEAAVRAALGETIAADAEARIAEPSSQAGLQRGKGMHVCLVDSA